MSTVLLLFCNQREDVKEAHHLRASPDYVFKGVKIFQFLPQSFHLAQILEGFYPPITSPNRLLK